MTKWFSEDDWGNVNVGDLVRLDRGEESLTVRVGAYSVIGSWIRHDFGHPFTFIYKTDGWSLFVQAPPAIVLPTKLGFYLDNTGGFWELSGYGWCQDDDTFTTKYVVDLAPFTRLEPVPQTAKEVLDTIKRTKEFAECSLDEAILLVGEAFGVTPRQE